jgi:hypothetical protein
MTGVGFEVMILRHSNNPPNGKRRVKSRACSSLSLTSRELFTRNSSWQAKQSIPYTTVTFYGDCVKMYQDFALNFGDKRTGYSGPICVSDHSFGPKSCGLSKYKMFTFEGEGPDSSHHTMWRNDKLVSLGAR